MAGALVVFEGRVRARHEGRDVDHLAYESFPAMAEAEGERIASEAITQFGLLDARIIHLVGSAAIGEPAVWVGVSAEHRQQAFLAAAWIMDTIKERLPVWKKETFADGTSEWVGTGCNPRDSVNQSRYHEPLSPITDDL